jgi:hypothetical protein
MKNIFDCYPAAYKLQKGNIYYDVKARPNNHFKALYLLSLEVEKLKEKSFLHSLFERHGFHVT